MDKTESYFPNLQELHPFVWLGYIDDIFFIWAHGEHFFCRTFNLHTSHRKKELHF